MRQHLNRLGVLLAEIALGPEVKEDDIAQNKREALENELIKAILDRLEKCYIEVSKRHPVSNV